MDVARVSGLAPGAQAFAGNVTDAHTTAGSLVTTWPDGTSRPTAPELSWPAGDIVPNLVVTELGAGVTDVHNDLGSTDVIADAEGWYS